MTVQYDNLPDELQDLIDEVRILMGDIEENEEDRLFTDNQWATILQATINDFNRARPFTDFTVDSFPGGFIGLLELGLAYHVALVRSNHLIEEIPIQGYQGPNIDLSQLHSRWSARAQELRPHWTSHRNKAKLLFLPKPVGTVNTYGWYGQTASVIPFLRALPTWNYAR